MVLPSVRTSANLSPLFYRLSLRSADLQMVFVPWGYGSGRIDAGANLSDAFCGSRAIESLCLHHSFDSFVFHLLLVFKMVGLNFLYLEFDYLTEETFPVLFLAL